MLETTRPIPPELVELIERTVRAAVGRFGLRSVAVRAGADHDGDPSIFIEAVHDLSETPIDPEVNSKLSMDLWLCFWMSARRDFRTCGTSIVSLQTVKGYPTAKRRRRSMP